MNTCKTCKHYDEGECRMIAEQGYHGKYYPYVYHEDSPPIEPFKDDRIIFGDGGHYDSVSVGENFGCIHHEAK